MPKDQGTGQGDSDSNMSFQEEVAFTMVEHETAPHDLFKQLLWERIKSRQ